MLHLREFFKTLETDRPFEPKTGVPTQFQKEYNAKKLSYFIL
jgi:hypothetical protein